MALLIALLEVLAAAAGNNREPYGVETFVQRIVCPNVRNVDLRVYEDRSYICHVNGVRVPVRLYIDNGR